MPTASLRTSPVIDRKAFSARLPYENCVGVLGGRMNVVAKPDRVSIEGQKSTFFADLGQPGFERFFEAAGNLIHTSAEIADRH